MWGARGTTEFAVESGGIRRAARLWKLAGDAITMWTGVRMGIQVVSEPISTGDLAKMAAAQFVDLVKAVNVKMKGFSRRETEAYYRDIIRRAWQQVEHGDTPQVRSELYDKQLEYLMLDDKFDQRTGTVFQRGPVYVPMWWGYYRPWGMETGAAAGARPAATPSGPIRLPTLPGGEFAAKMVRSIETTAGGIIHNLTDFTGKVTSVTNPLPKSSSSHRSGGSSGGCACACACACAGCACAGGGR